MDASFQPILHLRYPADLVSESEFLLSSTGVCRLVNLIPREEQTLGDSLWKITAATRNISVK